MRRVLRDGKKQRLKATPPYPKTQSPKPREIEKKPLFHAGSCESIQKEVPRYSSPVELRGRRGRRGGGVAEGVKSGGNVRGSWVQEGGTVEARERVGRLGWGGRAAGEGWHYICAGPANRAQYRRGRRRVHVVSSGCVDGSYIAGVLAPGPPLPDLSHDPGPSSRWPKYKQPPTRGNCVPREENTMTPT
ncbi:hypothetical protein KM043_002349 [Ampulex compressa]|nr:hypothetical protein KM043_002349 [Ampulex compressa]